MPTPIRARLAGLLALAALAFAPALAPAATDPAAAKQVAQNLVETAHAALTDTAEPQQKRTAQLTQAIDQAFAFDVWEKFLLGDQASKFSEQQLSEFRSLLPGFIANLYKSEFGNGLEAKPKIEGAKEVRGDVLVSAKIPRANGENLPVDWRVRDIPGKGPKVIDIMVGGTSFLILKRDEFSAILAKGGPAALLDYMRKAAI